MLSLDLEGPKAEVEKAIVDLSGLGLRMARRWS